MAHAARTQEEAEAESKEIATKDRPSRQDMAVALRIWGANYTEIAKQCGYTSAKMARLAVERGLAASVGEDDREQRRHLEARRLERLLRAVMPRATNEDDPEQVSYVRASLAIIDRHARLYGLDAPQEVVLYNPTERELESWLESKTALMQQDLPEEADIIEGESWEVIDSDAGDDD
jgi:hypothetical protein